MPEEITEKKDPNAWLDEISCDLGLRQHLDFEIEKANAEYVKSKNPSWYPSDLGKDLFIRFIKRKGYDALPFDKRTMRKFEIGKLWEARLHEVLDARISRGEGNIKEIDFHPDQPAPFNKRMAREDLELRGYYDRMLLVNDEKLGWLVVVYEVKSVSSVLFHKQKKDGMQPKGNRMQMMFYLKEIQNDWARVVEIAQKMHGITPVKAVGVLSQVSKDDGSMWERTYEFDPVLYKEIEDELILLNDYWKKDILPPKPILLIFEDGVPKLNWEISYSNYVHHILGKDYASIIDKAEKLVNRYKYYKKNAPSKVGIVEKEITDFNESLDK